MWWRRAIVGSILGLWLTVGIAWGARAAFVFGFFVLIAIVYAVWALAFGRLDQRAGSWYFERQLNGRTGRWRDRARSASGRLSYVPATVVVGAQWGDEGKGKIVDLLAQQSDVVCRYQGGPNAGHTIVVGDDTFKIRACPSGVISGKVSVIGAGCVVDPEVLIAELDELESRGIDTSVVVVSGNAHLIMPWHIAIDQASERRLGKLQIGTTRRGIGPCYADKASRIGIRVQDVLDPKILRQKIEVALAEKNVWLERVYEVDGFDLDEVATRYEGYAKRLRPIVGDTSLLVDEALNAGKEVLFEGAQATLLDLDHGTYPFVTSSNPIASGAATGIGIGPTRIDRVLGVAKAYVTRVGEGPFPSEIAGPDQERLRDLGGEFGTVTGRQRRCGWLDLVALRYAVRVNGITSLALTKLDAPGRLPRDVPDRLPGRGPGAAPVVRRGQPGRARPRWRGDARRRGARRPGRRRGLPGPRAGRRRPRSVGRPAARRTRRPCCTAARVVARYAKHHLPNYGVFDEYRYFVPGQHTCVVRVHGVDVALVICEDLWQDGGPVAATRAAGAGSCWSSTGRRTSWPRTTSGSRCAGGAPPRPAARWRT